jgi:uncharacterized protein (DUF2236 family)
MIKLLRKWQGEIKRTFTGSPDGVPNWVPRLSEGEDAGHHLPGSAVWAVHGGMPTIVAGIRALLMQALHPAALAGVHNHSRFREDPLGRLAGTIRWVFTVSYGSEAAARAASDFVLRLHETVTGEYVDGSGRQRTYAANDPELLSWVHIAFTDSFLAAHKLWGGRIPGGPDAYVREWAQAGRLMGVSGPPLSEKDMREQLNRWYDQGELVSDDKVAETVEFIRNPPLHPALKPGYKVLFAAAVSSLEPKYRALLGVRSVRLGPLPLPVNLATRVALGAIHLALGRVAPSEAAARERLRRLAITSSGDARQGAG